MELYIEPKIAIERKTRDKNGRFLKERRPANKGTKGLKGACITSFKKGNIPPNTKYDGAISTRKDSKGKRSYKYIRTAKAKWELYHRYIWKQCYGEIPKGYIVRFIDGDSMNCKIDNLECISRAENRNRNINYKKAAESIKKTWRMEHLRKIYGLPLETRLLERCKF